MEAQMREDAALARLGEMAAVVAHIDSLDQMTRTCCCSLGRRSYGRGRIPVAIDEVNTTCQIAIDCPPGGGTAVVVRLPMSSS